MNDWKISDIENLTESQLESMADMSMEVIKGHKVFFGTFGKYFKYSAIVCSDGQQLKHANEYQLHYAESRYPNVESLHKRFVERLNEKLFTEDELLETSDDYQEREAKRYYLMNIYSAKREYQSIWCCGEPAEWYKREKAEGKALFSKVAYAYYHWYDKWFVEHMQELWDGMEAANDPLRDYEHAYKAFKYEMFNHEYAISWQGDWDVIRCFANVDGDNAEDMLPKTGWSDEVKRAYVDAANDVMAAYANGPY